MNPESELLGRAVSAIAASAGFALERSYCDDEEMRQGIREIERLPPEASLNDLQGAALLENLRRVFLRTARIPGAADPMAKQASRSRWRFLTAASPQGASAYAAVLRLFGVPVPDYLSDVGGDQSSQP